MKQNELVELSTLGDSFRRFILRVIEQRDTAYIKLRAYKSQQSGLVANQRLLKLEYKELKTKYDNTLRRLLKADAENSVLAKVIEEKNRRLDALLSGGALKELDYSRTNEG